MFHFPAILFPTPRRDLKTPFSFFSSSRNAFIEEKRRIEAKVNQLEEELEDEQNNNEQMIEKLKKMQSDMEKLAIDLNAEKSNATKAENAKLALEKQNRELREKVLELEEASKGRSKTAIASLETKLTAMEEQLHLEVNEKQRISREFKKSEKRLRELQNQVEEERKQTENYREQVSAHPPLSQDAELTLKDGR